MRKSLRSQACFAALISVASSVTALAQTVPAPAIRDGSHDLDFSFGKWRTDITRYKDPFSDPKTTSHMSGTKTVTPVWGGKGALEEIEVDGPEGHWEAANLFLYDPAVHQWTQNYVDRADGHFEGAAGVGEYCDGKLEFYWQANVQGRALLVRGTWSDFTPNSHIYEVARSDDGGRTWHTSFVAHLTRIN